MAEGQSNTGYNADNDTKYADDKVQQSQIEIEILERFISYINNHDFGEIEPFNLDQYESKQYDEIKPLDLGEDQLDK